MKSYSVRIDENLLNKLHYMADYDGRSANSQILHYIKVAVASFEKEHGEIPIDTI